MYLIIKKNRLYKETEKNSDNIETFFAFGRKWETLTHSEEDKDLSSIWDRESRYMKLKKKKIKDGLYIMKFGKLENLIYVKVW